jgi:tRNA nucleotidyltransferase (CCA-adding enzyme)
MQHTKINEHIKRDLEQLFKKNPSVLSIAHALHAAGGRILLVGGAVRDLLLSLEVKDIDLEIHGIEADQLHRLLEQFGPVDYVGKAFGVFKFFDSTLRNIDIALPRADTAGRKPDVSIDPHMSIDNAFRRRDLTINAMGIDLITGELIDPFGGYDDLRNNLLRAVDVDFFVQDPLRFYRVMQFIGRFTMNPVKELDYICAGMDLSNVSIERIENEFEKLLLKSYAPSRGIRWLHTIGRLHDLFPEIGAMIGVAQNPQWHPEGDVFEHTMQAGDAAARFVYVNETDKLKVMYAALCHDLGKVTTTTVIDGKITSHGHEDESARCAKKVLQRITGKKEIIDAVVKLVACHMQPLQFINDGAKPAAYKRLARRLAPQATMQLLALLTRADRLGRNPESHEPLNTPEPDVDAFIKQAEQADVFYHEEKPILQGRDVMDIVAPGPAMGVLLKKAYEIQIEEDIRDKEELKRRVQKKI